MMIFIKFVAIILLIAILATLLSSFDQPEQEDTLLKLASDLHGNQKYDNKPYSYHLKMVRDNVRKFSKFYGDDPKLMSALEMAADFHDSIEDVPSYTYNDLKKTAKEVFQDEFYANMVTEIVYACSTEKGKNRKERAGEKYYEGIRNTGYAPFIKACDRLANIEYSVEHKSRMAKVYIKEMPEFIKNITSEDNPIPPELKEKLCQYLQD